MELLIWYSFNHNCFKTRIGFLGFDKDIGYINGFNEMLVQVIPLYKRHLSFKFRLIRFLRKVISRLEHSTY